MTLLLTSADTIVEFSPGALLVDISNGVPYANVDLHIDSDAVIISVQLDENGQAETVTIPVDQNAGSHTLHATMN